MRRRSIEWSESEKEQLYLAKRANTAQQKRENRLFRKSIATANPTRHRCALCYSAVALFYLGRGLIQVPICGACAVRVGGNPTNTDSNETHPDERHGVDGNDINELDDEA